ncbi:hypothetical protein FJZ31_00780 [Candidatus Poribacteria bacterium]|nr:hypothetical protein [Candidatus Poribacteria bacterium]
MKKQALLLIITLLGFVTVTLHAQVASVSPVQNALNVSPFQQISVTFSQQMDIASINDTTFRVMGMSSGLHTGTITYDPMANKAILIPTRAFLYGEIVSVTLTSGIQTMDGQPLTPFHWQFTTGVNQSFGVFSAKVDYTTGGYPNPVFVADLDDDGYVDLVIGKAGDNAVSIFKNNGDGTFQLSASYAVGVNPYSIFGADFDTDGDVDLAVVNAVSNTVSILKNNGNGTFQPRVDYVVGVVPLTIFVADFHGDGYVDLAVTNNGSNTISILKNNGNGTFQAKVDYVVGNEPGFIFAADFDSDGDIDLVVGKDNSTVVSVLMNNGDGTFQPKVDYIVGSNPAGIFAADLDGDGDLDLAVANNGSNTISILKNNGDGTFQTKVDYAVGVNPFRITATDIEGDGDIDLVVVNYDDISILKNNGDGKFQPNLDYTAGSGPADVFASDLDGNGDIDLVVTNYLSSTFSILKNRKTITAQIINVFPMQNSVNFSPMTNVSVIFNQAMDATTINDTTFRVAGMSGGVHTGTLTYDPTANKATLIPTEPFAYGEIVLVTLTNAIKTVDAQPLSSFQWQFRIAAIASTGTFSLSGNLQVGGNPQSIFTADFDGDKHADLAIANYSNNTLSILLNNGDGTFKPKADYPAGEHPSSVYGADLDGDGKAELAVVNAGAATVSIFKNIGDGTFQPRVDYATRINPWSVVISDIDGDSDNDLIVANGDGYYEAMAASVFKNNGNGTFQPKVDYKITGIFTQRPLTWNFSILISGFELKHPVAFKYSGIKWWITSVDTTHQISIPYWGLLSLPIPAGETGRISFGMGDYTGDPIFKCVIPGHNEQGVLHCREIPATNSISVNDIDNDGDYDIAISNWDPSSSAISVLKNNGDGSFAAKIDYETYPGVGPYSIYLADIDGNGYNDLIATNYFSDTLSVYINKMEGTFSKPINYATERWPYSIHVTDVDGDGYNDIIVANTNQNNVSVFKNNGDGTFQTRVNFSVGGSPWSIFANDFDADGDLDCVVTNIDNNTVSILANDQYGVPIPPKPTLASPLDGATGVSTKPTLSWNASSGAMSYQLQVSTNANFSTTVVDQSAIPDTSYYVTGLLNYTTYYWRVNASSAAGTSDWSSAWKFTTAPRPGDVSGNGEVTAYDASLVLQHVVGLIELSPDAQEAADVTGNGTITALDAALILQYTVGLIIKFPVESEPIAPAMNPKNETQVLAEAIAQLEDTPLTKEQKQVLEELKRLVSQKLPPAQTALFQNFPNPFNPETWIPFELAREAEVVIQIYNIKGELVRTLPIGHRPAGSYLSKEKAVFWNGTNQNGEAVANGLYFYTLKAGEFQATRKMILVK